VVDCSALPANLLESELFGHEKGAFTGATGRRIGAFEEANHGTLFLDEIGELPQDLQPKLLRVLEQRQIRRIGSNQYLPVDVRVVAATNRDLRAQVNEGHFRSDVYYRLAVVKIALPPLRERLEDIPLLVERFKSRLSVDEETAARLFTPDFLSRLGRATWPGNVRELRNFLERCVVMQQSLPLQEAEGERTGFRVDASRSYAEAKQSVVLEFERRYVKALLEAHGGNVSKAARAAEMDRPYLYKLLHRHGFKG
jgi:DNA-binding NtrC family response regulator